MRRIVLVTAVAIIVLAGVVLTTLHSSHSEPSYKGLPLGTWLNKLDNLKSEEAGEAIEAIKHIDTNSLPTLLKMVHARDSKIKTVVTLLLYKQSIIAVDLRSADQQHFEAYIAFRVLKGRAKSAIPALSVALRDTDQDVSDCALHCLLGIGPDAHKALANGSRDQDDAVRKMAESALAVLDSETRTN